MDLPYGYKYAAPTGAPFDDGHLLTGAGTSFGFDYIGISNQPAIIEFSTNLSEGKWWPGVSNLTTGEPEYFNDLSFPQPAAFYSIRSP